MKERILWIGVGQCGGNFTKIFEDNGYFTFNINASYDDLRTLDSKHYFHIVGATGCNKDQQKALEYAQDYYNTIITMINNKFPQQDIIFFVYSSDGGTGGGISPVILDLISQENPNKFYGATIILPKISIPSIVSQHNALLSYKHTTEVEGLKTLFVLDNNKRDDIFSINKEFFDLFDSFINITTPHEKGNIDPAEVADMFTKRGSAILLDIPEGNINEQLHISIKNSIFTKPSTSLGCQQLAVASNTIIPTDLLRNTFGKHINDYKGYRNSGTFIAVNGMHFPMETINQLQKQCNQHDNEVTEIKGGIEIEIPSLSIRKPIAPIESVHKKVDVKSIFAKYI